MIEPSTQRDMGSIETDVEEPLTRSSSSGPLLTPGTIYAVKYEVLSFLGGGASGQVYAARRLSDGFSCALKILRADHVGNRQPVERFRREAKILAQVAGPHIVRVHDFGEDESGRLFLALDYATGETLGELLSQGVMFTMDQVFDVMSSVCEALDGAHSHGVIHRDLKSENIIVDLQDDDVSDVFVFDFGLSKMLNQHRTGQTNLTEQNMVLGSPKYMSPEQVRGEDLDERCDIYSAGVVLYEMVYGEVPFDHSLPLPIMTAHLTQEPSWPVSRPDGKSVSPALLAVMQHALAKEPNDRYPTARKMLEALRKARHAPEDLVSVRPPPAEENDVAFSTTLSVAVPDSRPFDAVRRRSTVPPAQPPVEVAHKAPEPPLWPWILLLVGVGLLGLLAGILLALNI